MMQSSISFGQWIKNRRKALDLTQEALAQRVGCAPETLRKIEAGRRRPSQQLVELLAGALDISIDERKVFLFLARGDGQPGLLDPMPVPATSALPSVPTPLTPLIGRDAEVQGLYARLRQPDTRLVTMLGPGGVGKTRLVLALYPALARDFAGGVHWVALAPIHDAELVIPTIARSLGLRESSSQSLLDVLVARLQLHPAVLVLDNFEQVQAAATAITTLLLACPQLKVLVTSRVALRVRGEYEWPVAPLDIPDQSWARPVEELAAYGAVALFVDRVKAANPRWELTSSNAANVAAICARLDGLPLALELAAARIKVLGVSALRERLDQCLTLLSGGVHDLPIRQQSLRMALQWSYDLLAPAERILFARLGVFVGGYTLHVVEAICDAGFDLALDLLDGLTTLVDNSLVQVGTGANEPRFNMLETIRAYAVEQLKAQGELELLRQQHAHYFLNLAERAAQHLQGSEQRQWLDRLGQEHDNLRAALSWAIETGNPPCAARLAAALGMFWELRGYLSEGRRWLDEALRQELAPGTVRGAALLAAGRLATMQADYVAAGRLYDEALGLAEASGSAARIADALDGMGKLALSHHDLTLASTLCMRGLPLARQAGRLDQVASLVRTLAVTARLRSEYDLAARLFEESLGIWRSLGDLHGCAICLRSLGGLYINQNDMEGARNCLEASLALSRDLGDQEGVAFCLNSLGVTAFHRGEYRVAGQLYHESLAISRSLGDPVKIALALVNLGEITMLDGAPALAFQMLRECIAVNPTSNHETTVYALEVWAHMALRDGQHERVVVLRGAASALRTSIGIPIPPCDRVPYDVMLADARRQLVDTAFEVAWSMGQAMTVVEAIDYAMHSEA